jgi:hypothetical protein
LVPKFRHGTPLNVNEGQKKMKEIGLSGDGY